MDAPVLAAASQFEAMSALNLSLERSGPMRVVSSQKRKYALKVNHKNFPARKPAINGRDCGPQPLPHRSHGKIE